MKYFVGLFFFVVPMMVQAHSCTGEVLAVDVNAAGNVYVTIEGIGDGNILCSLKSVKGEYEAEACKGVLGLAMAAKMAQKKIRLYFRNDADTVCQKGIWKDFSSSSYQLYHVRLEG